MPQIVEIPGVGEAEFPDDYSQDQIAGILRERFPPQTGRLRSAASTLAQAIESGIGTGIQGFANIPRQISAAVTGGDAEAVQTERNTIVDSLARLSQREREGRMTPELAAARTELESRLGFLESQSDSGPVTEALYGAGEAIRKDAVTRFQPNPAYREEFLAGTVPQVAGSAIQSVTPFLMSPGIGVANMAGQVFQDTYEENLAKGVPQEEAARRGVLNSIVSGGLESVSGGIVANIAKRIGSTPLSNLAPEALRGMVQGAVSEFATGASQEAAGQIINREQIDAAEIARQGGLEALGSLFITGPAVSVGALTDRLSRDLQNAEPDIPNPQTQTEARAAQSLGLPTQPQDAVQVTSPESQVLRDEEAGQSQVVELPGVAAQDQGAVAQAQAVDQLAELNTRVEAVLQRRRSTDDPDQKKALLEEARGIELQIAELESQRGRLGPGAANAQEMNQRRVTDAADILVGISEAQGAPATREQWERNFLIQYPELEGDQQAIESAWTAAQSAAQQYTENEGRQPMPQVVAQQSGAPVGEGTTGIKNAQADLERRARGLPAAHEVARRAQPAVWDEAMRQMEANPQAQAELVERLRQNPMATVNDTETAMLLHRQIELENQYDRAVDAVNRAYQAGDEMTRDVAIARAKKAEQELIEIYDINKVVGTAQGRSLAARKMMARRDYTLARMVAEARSAKGGEQLTDAEMDQVEQQFEGIQETQTKLDERLEQIEEEESGKAMDSALEQMRKDQKDEADPQVKTIAQRIIEYLDKRAVAARARLRQKFQQVGSAPDPTIIVDLADLAASSIGKGVTRFSVWAADMVQEFGEGVRQYLDPAWKLANDNIDEQVQKATKPKNRTAVGKRVRKLEGQALRDATALQMQNRLNAGTALGDLREYVNRIAESFVREGVTQRDALVEAVRGVVDPLVPGITSRQVADLISGYGDFKQLDQDAIKQQMRDIRGQLQQVSKLEDLASRKSPLKTGVERRTPSREEARLIREVNEAKRKYGVVTTDPATQLKSILDAVKTRLRNQIKDLTTQIETGQKPTRRTPVEYDQEADTLAALRDRLRQTLEDIEGRPELTDEQRVAIATKALERSIAEYERKIKDRDISPIGRKSTTPKTPALEAMRARRDALSDELNALKAADEAVKQERQAGVLIRQIQDLEQRLSTGDVEPSAREQTADTELIASLKAQRDALRERINALRPKTPKMTEEERQVSGLERQIQELERRIAEGDTARRGQRQTVDTEQVARLKAQRKSLMEQLDALRPKTPKLTEEEKQLATIERQIKSVEERIATRNFEAAPKKQTADTREIAEARERLRKLRETLTAMDPSKRKRSEEEKQVAALERQIKALEDRIANRAFTPSERRSSADTRLIAETRVRLEEVRRRFAEMRESDPAVARQRLDRALDRANDTIKELDQRLQSGDISVRNRKASDVHPELEAKRSEIKAMRSLMSELRAAASPKATPEEIALKSLKTRLANQNADLQARIARQDFSKRVRKPVDISRDREAVRLKAENETWKAKFEAARLRFEREHRTRAQKVVAGVKEALNLPRAVLSSMDVSAVLRQGGIITFGNPVRALRSMGAMFRALASETQARRIDTSIRSRPNAPFYKPAGLFLAEIGDVRLTAKEEAIMSELADKIPGVRASNRAYVTFLNKIRADSFDAMVGALSKGTTPTLAEMKAIANYINIATGRGDLGAAAKAAETLATIFFSPRLLVSRFQYLTAQPLRKGMVSGEVGSARVRRAIAKEYAKTLTGVGLMLGLGLLAGADIEDDPRSSDFGKLRFGDTRVDLLAGLAQVTVLLSRLTSGETKTLSGKMKPIRGEGMKAIDDDSFDVATRFLRTKLAPVLGSAVNVVTGRNVVGEKVVPIERTDRFPFVRGELVNLGTPLSFRDIAETMEEQGWERGTIMSLLNLFGAGVQTYSTEKPPTR